MIRYRYSRWDPLQEAIPFDVDQLMDHLSDRVLEDGDIDVLLQRLCQRGTADQEGNQIKGLQDLWRDLQKKRQELLEKYDLDSLYQSLRDQLRGLTQERIQEAEKLIKELNEMIRERIAGARPDYQGFLERYGDRFPPNYRELGLDKLLDRIQKELAQMESLLQSMPREMREEIEKMMQEAFLSMDEGLREQLQELSRNLAKLSSLRSYPFWGKEPLDIEQALRVKEQFDRIEQLEETLREIQRGQGCLKDLPASAVLEVLGEEGRQQVERLQRLLQQLEARGYIYQRGDRYILSPRGIRRIGQKALRDIFAHLKKDPFGHHTTERPGIGGLRIDESHRYEYGDPFDLHLEATLKNSLLREADGLRSPLTFHHPPIPPPRSPHLSLRLLPGDFETYRQENLTQTSLVLMLDMSGSMDRYNKFLAAKKVAMAMEQLIRSQFPRDGFKVVGFYTLAQEILLEDLPFVHPKPFGFSSLMMVDHFGPSWGPLALEIDSQEVNRMDIPMSFTNIQEGLKLSRQILSQMRGINKQIILITDGEPTAHFEGSYLYLQYPPSQRTLQETFREVKRCTADGIVINTFMLGKDRFLERFVDQLARINRGRAFFTTPDRIGEYVVVDYLSRKRKKIA